MSYSYDRDYTTQVDGGQQGGQQGVNGAASWGGDGLAVPGSTGGDRSSDSSPIPQGAAPHVQGAGSRSLPGVPAVGGGGTAGGVAGDYLETDDKRSPDLASFLKTHPEQVKDFLERPCPGHFLPGSCPGGHRFAKTLFCGREWCPVCGKKWSAAHQRRFSRLLGRAMQVGSMGYFTFTLPEALRAKYRRKKALSGLGHQVQELLKSYGYSRGLRRWHYFGDRSTRYHPHLNCLVDGGYLHPGKLEAIKRSYAALLGVEPVDVRYEYRQSPGRKVHALKYITRATFHDWRWDAELALELRGFRNQCWWGSKLWNDSPVWSLEDCGPGSGPEDAPDEGEVDLAAVGSLESGLCPRCGKPIEWARALPIGILELVEKSYLGAGYWELESVRPP
mgnify:CR=1 FL=1